MVNHWVERRISLLPNPRWVGIKKPVLTTGRVMGENSSTTIIPLGVVLPGHDCFSFQIDSAFKQSAVLMVPTRYEG